MSSFKRFLRVLAVIAAILVASTYVGNFHAGRWIESADRSVGTAWASPQSFAPDYSPTGGWIICIEGASGFETQMEGWLKDRLSDFAGEGMDAVQVVSSIPDDLGGANALYVRVKPSAMWTPFYSTYNDEIEVRYSNQTLAGWPGGDAAVGTLSQGELRINARVTASGSAVGVIGRPYLGEHRAKILSDNVKAVITDAYESVRKAARNP